MGDENKEADLKREEGIPKVSKEDLDIIDRVQPYERYRNLHWKQGEPWDWPDGGVE